MFLVENFIHLLGTSIFFKTEKSQCTLKRLGKKRVKWGYSAVHIYIIQQQCAHEKKLSLYYLALFMIYILYCF